MAHGALHQLQIPGMTIQSLTPSLPCAVCGSVGLWERSPGSKSLRQLHIPSKTAQGLSPSLVCDHVATREPCTAALKGGAFLKSVVLCCLQVPGSKSHRRLQARVSQHVQTAQQAFGGSPLRPTRGAQASPSPSREPVARALAARFDDSVDNHGAGWSNTGGRCCTRPADSKAAANNCSALMHQMAKQIAATQPESWKKVGSFNVTGQQAYLGVQTIQPGRSLLVQVPQPIVHTRG